MASNFILKHDYASLLVNDSQYNARHYIISHQFLCFFLLITKFCYQKLICIVRHKFLLLGTHFFYRSTTKPYLASVCCSSFSHNPRKRKHKRLMAEGKVIFFTFTLQLAPLMKTFL